MTLTLIMLGLLTLLGLLGNEWQKMLKEQVTVQVFMQQEMDETGVARVKKIIDTARFTKAAEYITSEQASQEMEKQLGEEFVDFLGFMPIPPSIDVQLKPEYTSLDSLQWISEQIGAIDGVKEVEYQRVLLSKIEQNINRLSLPLLLFASLLLLIAVALINNTIRLSIFSRRFIIKSMQLVGATRGFIRRPFILKGIWLGVLSGLLAFSVIVGLLGLFRRIAGDWFEMLDVLTFAQLFGAVMVLGIFIAWVSTHLAVNKYIRLRHDQLY
ncbi:MAG: hypothetical protein RL226_779 [Bacteroidota bacterium]|jgi:cell division transport system permease protein